MDSDLMKQIIEALLFASNRPLSLTQIREVLEQTDVQEIKNQLSRLRQEYQDSGRSFNIREIAGGYQITTDPKFADWLTKLYAKSRKERLTRPSLETLAIIAYRQPITRVEIENIRGVNVDGVLKTLLERALVRISGRKQIPGRPFLYGTTRQFLELFGLQSLNDLPQMEDFGELLAKGQLQSELMEQGEDKPDGGEQNVQIEDIAQENRPD